MTFREAMAVAGIFQLLSGYDEARDNLDAIALSGPWHWIGVAVLTIIFVTMAALGWRLLVGKDRW